MSEYWVNPGSDEALEIGCRCPVIDNGRGHGSGRFVGNTPLFWMSSECPIHGERASLERERYQKEIKELVAESTIQ